MTSRNSTKRPMKHWLPPTPVHEGLRIAVIAMAKEHGISITELQRRALTLFLVKYDTNCINRDTSPTTKNVVP